MTHARSLAIVVAVCAGFVVTGGCWSATEATIRLSTDLACAQSLRTVVYVGAPNAVGTVPVADTTACTTAKAAGADNEIGTLTVVPGAAKDGRVEVRAVIAQNGQDPARCVDDGTDCIVQTRVFDFVEHSAQSIPIRLLQQCLGTVCPAGETCIGPQQCSSSGVTCASTDSCVADAGTAPPDAGIGPFVACEQRGEGGVLARASSMPDDQLSTYVHGAPRRIVWYDNGARPANALNVTPVDGSRAPAAYGLGSIRPTAFADAWDGSFVAVRPAEKGALIAYAAAASKRQYLLDMPVLAIAARGGLVLVGGDRVELVDVDLQTQQNVATFRASRVAMTTDFLIASDVDGSGVHRYPYGAGKVDLAADVPLPFYADNGAVAFAVTPDGARAFVAGTTASVIDPVGGKGVVIASVDTPTAIVATGSAEPVTSLAVDRTRAYWTHGASEISYASGASKVVSIATEGRVGQLAIDENCLYYWQERDGSAQLRAITKPQ